MTNKTQATLLTLLLLATLAHAGCEGNLNLIQPPNLKTGDTYDIISYTTIDATQGPRNWDLRLEDPQGNTVSQTQTRIDNNTYTLTAHIEITNSHLTGTYTIHSQITVLNPTNQSQTQCTETTTQTFQVNTTRKKYDTATLILQLLPEYESFTYTNTENVNLSGRIIPMNISIRNLPMNVSVAFSEAKIFSSTEASINLSAGGVCWNNELIDNVSGSLAAKDRIIESFSVNLSQQVADIGVNCATVLAGVEDSYLVCLGEVNRSRLELDLVRHQNRVLEGNLSSCGLDGGGWGVNFSTLAAAVVSPVVCFLVFFWYVGRNAEKKKE